MVPSTIIGNITVHVSNDGVFKCPSFLPHSVELPPSVLKVLPSSCSHLGGLAVTIFGFFVPFPTDVGLVIKENGEQEVQNNQEIIGELNASTEYEHEESTLAD